VTVAYKDYYKVLGVDKTADAKAIKQAYRRLARKYHPDLKPGDRTAAERFKEINEANEVLSDPEKRRRYDELGADWARYADGGFPGAGPDLGGFRGRAERAGDAGDFSEFFRTFFGDLGGGRARAGESTIDLEDLLGDALGGRRGAPGRGGRGARATRGYDLETPVEISLEEAAQGTTRGLELDGRRLDVKIPAGVRQGSRVRVTGEGAAGSGGGARGDLYLRVHVQPHPLFERRDDDLHVELPLAVWEAALGAEIEVPTLRGKVTMKIPPETASGQTFRLPGYGVPHVRSGGRGDQFVRVKVVVPRGLSDAERAAFEELRRLRPSSPR
jgi:curved DNA-binding protein